MRYPKLVATENKQEFLLLGYPLHLSPDEAELVHTLQGKRSLASKSIPNTSANALAVRVCSINKKAIRVSGRRLIIFENGAYRLNPYL
ncbi:MAG: hypothetical protein IJD64_06095 [Clostridia bacterium]|nr:hypothetical protein [Clostridia bacterium]